MAAHWPRAGAAVAAAAVLIHTHPSPMCACRGFETCTIVLSGRVRHEDSVGNKGVIGPGGVQWMTAGRGIIHSEFPESQGDEMLHGFQVGARQLHASCPSAARQRSPRLAVRSHAPAANPPV